MIRSEEEIELSCINAFNDRVLPFADGIHFHFGDDERLCDVQCVASCEQ